MCKLVNFVLHILPQLKIKKEKLQGFPGEGVRCLILSWRKINISHKNNPRWIWYLCCVTVIFMSNSESSFQSFKIYNKREHKYLLKSHILPINVLPQFTKDVYGAQLLLPVESSAGCLPICLPTWGSLKTYQVHQVQSRSCPATAMLLSCLYSAAVTESLFSWCSVLRF